MIASFSLFTCGQWLILAVKVVSEAISEVVNYEILWGSMPPDPPSYFGVLVHTVT